MSVADILLRRLCLDAGTQSRAGLDMDNVSELRELLQAGEDLDPIEVVFDALKYYVIDGFHRVEAHAREGRKAIRANVRRGTLREAILLSVGANARHGLRRTNADKRRAVETLLDDPEWGLWKNREIARHCGVDEYLVRKMKAERSGAVKPQRNEAEEVTREVFDALSPAAKIRLQQKTEERAQRQREEEERREAAAEQRQTVACKHCFVCQRCGEVR